MLYVDYANKIKKKEWAKELEEAYLKKTGIKYLQ